LHKLSNIEISYLKGENMATTSSGSSRTWQWWVSVVAFVSLAIIGVVLLLDLLFDIGGGVFTDIAHALAYIVVASCAFVYASSKMKRKNGIWYMIIWVVAVILVIVVYIVPFFQK
jgi:heme/copper-type cytochrome/quinol oxidase subunit 4